MAGLAGPLHTIGYVNVAFCLLTGKSKDELIGTAFSSVAYCPDECLILLDRVAKTGLADSHTGQEQTLKHPLYGRTRCGRYTPQTRGGSGSWCR
jgi:PAS domain-containing protein